MHFFIDLSPIVTWKEKPSANGIWNRKNQIVDALGGTHDVYMAFRGKWFTAYPNSHKWEPTPEYLVPATVKLALTLIEG